MKVIASSPTRISLLGGGTDISPYAELRGGCVINISINIRQHVILKTDRDRTQDGDIFPPDANPNFYYKIMDEYNIDRKKVNIYSTFDGKIESGLGSSSAAIVALIGCLRKYCDLPIDKRAVAEEAHRIEKNRLGVYCGRQDHYAAAYGGFNFMAFGREVFITPMKTAYQDDILQSMVLFHTGIKRGITSNQDGFRNLTPDKIKLLDSLKEAAYGSVDYINQGRLSQLAASITYSWVIKRQFSNVSNTLVDEAINLGRENGAMAGKIIGKGSGGYILFMVDPHKRKEFIEKMVKLDFKWVDFDISKDGLSVRTI